MPGDNKFHFNKEISIGNLLTAAALGVALATWSFTLEKRISVNEVNISNQTTRTSELQSRIDDSLRRIDRKLDVIVDRQIEQQR